MTTIGAGSSITPQVALSKRTVINTIVGDSEFLQIENNVSLSRTVYIQIINMGSAIPRFSTIGLNLAFRNHI